jgi:hypothetical protein
MGYLDMPDTALGRYATLGFDVGKKGYKAFSYYKDIQQAMDRNRRTGGLLKLGIRLSADIAGAILGESITSHPYFSYHKAHIEALADALNVSANNKRAIEAFNKAVKAADSTTIIRNEMRGFQLASERFALDYIGFFDSLRLQREVMKGALTSEVAKEIAESGISNASLRQSEDTLKLWRARWIGLYFYALKLLTMTEVELGNATEAMAEFNKIMKAMMAGGSMSQVAGYATETDRQWAQYDRMKNPSAGEPEMAVNDPVRYAELQRDRIARVSKALAEMCEFVVGDEVRSDDKFATRYALYRLQMAKA